MSHQSSSALTPVIIGIDWADRQHDVCIIDAGCSTFHVVKHDPSEIADWLEQLRKKFPERPLLIAVEQGRGGLIHALQEAEGIVIYSINPKQLARFREALYPAGGKNDPTDAELIATFLLNHRQKLRPWQPDDAQTRKLGYLSELRRKLVEERKRLGLRLEGTLKNYFPLVLSFGKTTSNLLLELLSKWPTLAELKRPHPKTLRQFLQEYGVSNEEQQAKIITTIRSAKPLTTDSALLDSHALYVQSLVKQIQELNRAVAQFDEQLKQTLAKHPDESIFRSVPGAGDTLVPRLIAVFGTNRQRYQAAEEVQSYTGIAPITKKSGQSRIVLQRHACPKFLKQTFQEFAEQARRWSSWSKAFYDLKRSRGFRHQAAVRELAFKWIRIMFRLWKSKSRYSETEYIAQLRLKKSPLLAFLPNS